MRAVTLAAVGLLLAGCGNRATWVKDGATEQDAARDSYGCERDMRQSGYFGGGLMGALNAQGFYNRCMEANGYRLVNTTALPTPEASSDLDARLQAGKICDDPAVKVRYPNYSACFFDHYKP